MPRADIHIRTNDPTLSQRLRDGASVRGWTLAQYLNKLLSLHDSMRNNSSIDRRTALALEHLGLQTTQKEG